MALHFILGRAGSGKSVSCLNAIREELQKNPQGKPLILLVPEQATFINEMALLDRQKVQGSIRGEVLSFQRLARRYGGKGKKTWLDSTGKTMLAAKCIESHRQELRLFNAASWHEGFIAMVLAAMEELERYNIDPPALAMAAAHFNSAAPESIIARKLRDLSIIYNEYYQGVSEEYSDSERGLRELAAIIPKQEPLCGAEVWVDGFATFTPIQLSVLGALMSQVKNIHVALCLPPEKTEAVLSEEDIFFDLWQTRQKLLSLAKEKGVPLGQTIALQPGGRFDNEELAAVEQHFAGEWVMPEAGATGNILVAQAATKRGEVAWTGRRILELCRIQGYRFRDMGIILRHMEDYDDLIGQVFAEMGIPVFLDSPRQLLFHPLVEFLRSALEVASEGWRHEPVFRYLKSGLPPLTGDEINQLGNYCLAYGIRDRDWQKKEDWQLVSGQREPTEKAAYLAYINEIRYKGSRALQEFCRQTASAENVLQVVVALRQLLLDIKASEKINGWILQFRAEGQLEAAAEHAQVMEDIENLFCQAVSFLGQEKMTLNALAEILDSGFAALTARLIPPSLDEVFVADLQRSRTPSVKVCFVLGANERIFPAAVADDGFFTSSERNALKEAGWELAPGGRERQLAEEYLVYIALSRASEKLSISYALSGEQGEPLSPSPVLRRLRRLFPDLKTTLVPRQPGPADSEEYIGGRRDTINQLARQLRLAKEGAEIAPGWWQAYDWFSRQAQWRQSLALLCRGIAWQPDTKPIASELTPRLYGKTKVSSISRLEAFNRCPCRYFAHYGLKLRPPRQYTLERLDMGSLYHLLLSEASYLINEELTDWALLEEAQLEPILERVLEKIAKEEIMVLLHSSSRYTYCLKRAVAIVKATLLAMKEQAKMGSFRPVAFEVGFGPKEAWPGWRLKLPNGQEIVLEGRIDRIDIARKDGADDQIWLRVVDFKSSNKDLLPEEIAQGISLQLPAYLKIAMANAAKLTTGRPHAAGMFYMTVQDKLKNEGSAYTGPGELKLKGLAVLDAEAARLSEHELKGKAKTIPVTLKADGSFGSSKGIVPEALVYLEKQVAETIGETVCRIDSGEVLAAPWQGKNGSACDYCDYSGLCAMDRIKTE